MVAPAAPLEGGALEELLVEMAAFAADWQELRSITRNRLQGRVVTPVLQGAVEEVNAAAVSSGRYPIQGTGARVRSEGRGAGRHGGEGGRDTGQRAFRLLHAPLLGS